MRRRGDRHEHCDDMQCAAACNFWNVRQWGATALASCATSGSCCVQEGDMHEHCDDMQCAATCFFWHVRQRVATTVASCATSGSCCAPEGDMYEHRGIRRCAAACVACVRALLPVSWLTSQMFT